MRNAFLALVLLSLIFSTAPLQPALAADAWQIDPVHSAIVFNISHNNGAGLVYGRFNSFQGTIMADPDQLQNSSIEVTVDASSVDTAVQKRDDHLRSADFFNIAQFATLSFKSSSVKAVADAPGRFEVSGEFTLLGVSQPLTVIVNQRPVITNEKGMEIAGFDTEFTIKRSDFGMLMGIPGVGDEVHVMLAFECGKVQPETAAAAAPKSA